MPTFRTQSENVFRHLALRMRREMANEVVSAMGRKLPLGRRLGAPVTLALRVGD